MTQDVIVSVVVPVYNVAKYLDRCVNSLISQTYTNLEIILVDDGSTDDSGQMCDEWARRDHRIKVVHKRNAGLGMARNTGIECATGAYVCFVDSDDYVLPQMIECAVAEAEKQQSDIAVYGAICVNAQGEMRYIRPTPTQTVYVGEDIQRIYLPEYIGDDPVTGKDSGIPGSAWASLISMELIRETGWEFVSEREFLMEDVYSMMKLCRYAKKIAVITESFYCYCENETSLTHSYRPDRFEKTKFLYRKCLELCEDYGYPETVRSRCGEILWAGVITSLKQEVVHMKDRRTAIKRIGQIIGDEMIQRALDAKRKTKINLKKKIFFWAMAHRYRWLCYVLLRARQGKTQ